ncbi:MULTISPECIES: oligosaccharide flippase family protein [unclassified Sulfitobacter]|uniref:oligosaccharide flippase family protein n=1 Tax=unclassified Sulfitobacter TaxID=196795 RepID=UPI0037470A24
MIERFHVRLNVVVSMVSFGVNLVLVFFSYRLVIGVGGLEALGLWSALMAWIFLIRLGDVGMGTATIRFVAQCDIQNEVQRVRGYVDTAIIVNTALFSILSILGYTLYSANLTHIVPDNADAQATARGILPLLFVGFFVSNISGLVNGSLTGIHRGYQSAGLNIVGSVVQLGIVLWYVPQIGLAGLAWGLVGQHLVIIIAGWVLFLIAMRQNGGGAGGVLPIGYSHTALREMLSFSLKIQLANILNGLFEPLSKILIGRIAGLEALGLFELAFKAVAMPRNVIVSGVHATVPSMSRLLVENRAAARDLFNVSQRRLMLGATVITALVILALPAASWLVLGRTDATLWLFTIVLGFGFLGNSMGATAYVLCIASGRAEYLIVSSLAALLLLVVLVPVAGLIMGITAQVAGVAIALTGGGLAVRFMSRKVWEHP